jgi:hypothetical protein
MNNNNGANLQSSYQLVDPNAKKGFFGIKFFFFLVFIAALWYGSAVIYVKNTSADDLIKQLDKSYNFNSIIQDKKYAQIDVDGYTYKLKIYNGKFFGLSFQEMIIEFQSFSSFIFTPIILKIYINNGYYESNLKFPTPKEVASYLKMLKTNAINLPPIELKNIRYLSKGTKGAQEVVYKDVSVNLSSSKFDIKYKQNLSTTNIILSNSFGSPTIYYSVTDKDGNTNLEMDEIAFNIGETVKFNLTINKLSELLADEFNVETNSNVSGSSDYLSLSGMLTLTDNDYNIQNLNIDSKILQGGGSFIIKSNPFEKILTGTYSYADFSYIEGSSSLKFINDIANTPIFSQTSFDVNIKKIKFSNLDVANFIFKSYLTKDNISIIKTLSLNFLDGGGMFISDARVDYVSYIPEMHGKINIQHPNVNKLLSAIGYQSKEMSNKRKFSLNAKFVAALYNINLFDIYMELDKNIFFGSAASKKIGDHIKYYIDLNINNASFDQDEVPFLKPLKTYARDLVFTTKDNSYSEKYSILRNKDVYYSIFLHFSNPTIYGKKISYLDFQIENSSTDVIMIRNFSVNLDKDNYVYGKGNIDLSNPIPIINITTTKGQANIKRSGVEKFINYFSNDFDSSKIQVNFDSKFDSINYIDNKINNFNCKMHVTNNDGIKVADCKGDFNGKDFALNAKYLPSSDYLNGGFAFSSYNLNTLSSSIFDQKTLLNGLISISGAFNSRLKNLDNFFNVLEVRGDFIGKFVSIPNFNFDKIFMLISGNKIYDYELDIQINNINYPGSMSYFNEATGKISTKGKDFTLSNCSYTSPSKKGKFDITYSSQNKTVDIKVLNTFDAPYPGSNYASDKKSVSIPCDYSGSYNAINLKCDLQEAKKYVQENNKLNAPKKF